MTFTPSPSPGLRPSEEYAESADESEELASVRTTRQERVYDQLISQCGAHLLAIVVVLLVYGAWHLLQDYRDAILWAILCSVTLRDFKVHLTNQAQLALDTERSLASLCLSALYSPVLLIQTTVKQILEFLKRWRNYAMAYEQQCREDKKKSMMQTMRSQSLPTDMAKSGLPKQGAHPSKDESRSDDVMKRTKSIRRRRRRATVSGVFLGFLEIGQLGVKAYRGGTSKELLQPFRVETKESQSPPLLSALMLAIAIYQSSCWVLSSWSSTLQLIVLSSTILGSLVVLPFCYLVAHLFLSMSNNLEKRRAESMELDWQSEDTFSAQNTASFRSPISRPNFWMALKENRLYKAHRGLDKYLKEVIAGSIHSLVAASLVLGLVIGSSCLLIFLSVQIGQESSTAVRSVHEAARQWATIDLSDSPAPTSSGPVGTWILGRQVSMGRLLQENLPAAAEWAESHVNTAVEAYNLTQVRDDMKALYASVVPAKSCSDEQKQQHLIALARASVASQKANEDHDTISQQIKDAEQRLGLAVNLLENRLAPKQEVIETTDVMKDAEEGVVECDRHLRNLQRLHLPAHQKRDETLEKKKIAEEAVKRCQNLRNRPLQVESNDKLEQLGTQLAVAYNHLWSARFREGLHTLQDVGEQVVRAGTNAFEGKEDHGLNTLSRIAKAAAEPLVALSQTSAKVLASSTYSGTVLALTSGLGIFRLGLGILKSAVQMVVFLALLFYLLAADTDPVAAAFQMFPLSKAARVRVSHSIEQSMRGVLVAACKLAVFHALFTWLTLRIFDVHLVYLSSLASAVFACVPFIPSWVIALPAAAQLLFIQDRLMAAVGLLSAHFFAWYLADDIILREIPSTHPYITGLGIFGGIATFSNPLQGAIFGPMALSVLSVAYNLHSDMSIEGVASLRSNQSGSRLQESQ